MLSGSCSSSTGPWLTLHARAVVRARAQIVGELDKHIIGQADAKRAVAIALRNRWRRLQLPEALRAEVCVE